MKARPVRLAWCLLLAVVLAGGLPACRSADQDAVRAEVAAFMLDYLLHKEMGAASYRTLPNPPWEELPADAGLIVYAPTKAKRDSSFDTLDDEHPLAVWWFSGDQLVEASEMKPAIDGYRAARMSASARGPWMYIEFGVLSVSRDGRQAEVYSGMSCGPLCGIGYQYRLEKDDSGVWQVSDMEMVWIS